MYMRRAHVGTCHVTWLLHETVSKFWNCMFAQAVHSKQTQAVKCWVCHFSSDMPCIGQKLCTCQYSTAPCKRQSVFPCIIGQLLLVLRIWSMIQAGHTEGCLPVWVRQLYVCPLQDQRVSSFQCPFTVELWLSHSTRLQLMLFTG